MGIRFQDGTCCWAELFFGGGQGGGNSMLRATHY